MHAFREVTLRFPDKPNLFSELTLQMVQMYQSGVDSGMWRDAEEYLDYVETARVDTIRDQLLRQLTGNTKGTPQQRATALKQFVAARVCTFLQGANLESELWAPYIRWARTLTPDDTVITFNWDRVLEMIAEFGTRPAPAMAAQLAGKAPIGLTAKSFEPDPDGCVRVLKLHGSVDWKRRGTHHERTEEPLFALDCEDDQIAIATPGPAKQGATESFLVTVWKRATAALSTSKAVVFLGYRFPPSDSQARESLLIALSAPSTTSNFRVIHTILGPSMHDEAPTRLGGLISGVLDGYGWHNIERPGPDAPPRYRLQQHPLYGQDFMSVFSRSRLLS